MKKIKKDSNKEEKHCCKDFSVTYFFFPQYNFITFKENFKNEVYMYRPHPKAVRCSMKQKNYIKRAFWVGIYILSLIFRTFAKNKISISFRKQYSASNKV